MERLIQAISRLFIWLTHRPGYLLLVGPESALEADSPRRFASAWWGLMLHSIAWGIVLTMVWNQAFGFFGEITGIRIMPAVAAVTFLALWPFRRAVAAAADLVAGPDGTTRAIIAAVLVGLLMLAIVSAKPRTDHPEFLMPRGLEWVRPDFVDCRVLLLMPLWGAWSMLITAKFCKPTQRTEPAVAAFAGGCGALAATGLVVLPWAANLFYLDFLGRYVISVSAITTVWAILAGLLMCRRAGGLSRQALLATNMLTQVMLLLAYLLFQNRMQ